MKIEIGFPGGKKVNAKYKDFIIKTDQSQNSGGDGIYPEPFTLFLSSIGTCTGLYVLRFCQERNIDTEDLKLILKIERNDKTNMISRIDIYIQASDSFPDKYINAVIKAASICTVKKHLEKPPKIDIFFKKNNE
jgi:ribosomal protein S12 methylthiotransferase accessory factor